MARYIVAQFPDTYSAEGAVADLMAAGFDEGKIHLMRPDQRGTGDVVQQSGVDSEGGLARFGDWLRAELARLGIGREEADWHHQHVLGGSAVVSVDAEGREAEARLLLQRAGASNMDQPAEAAAAEASGTTTGTWQMKPEVENENRPATILDDTAPGAQTAGGYDTPDDVVRRRSEEAQQEDEDSPLERPEASARDHDIVEHPDQLGLH